ncbi:hypothetical protein [Clavibacter michiganensis]|uniref:hypothetical protein n=1 Tax=Clavibacter michiganensis TaxID=28447 RepID=UPI00292EE9F5|nr:hypothetical protein [Clavibacter michiganensis]
MSGRKAKAKRAAHKPKQRISTGWAAYDAGRAATVKLEAEVDAYFSREPARITADPADESKLIGQEPLPEEWGDQMFIALQFLRSALEYVAYDLTMMYTPDANPSKTAFPVAREERDWTKSGGEKRFVEHMHPGAAAIIESVQPFNTLHPGYESILESLHDFARVYRHRRPPILVVSDEGRGPLHTDYLPPMAGNRLLQLRHPEVEYVTPSALAGPNDELPEGWPRGVPAFKHTAFHPELGSGMGAGDGTPLMWVLRSGYRFIRNDVLRPLDEYLRDDPKNRR